MHFDAAAVVDGEIAAVLPAPVGLDQALKAPAVTQDAALVVLVLAGPDSVDLVVARHHAEGLALLDGRLERGQIDFVERARVHVRIDVVAVPLLVVEAEVLDRRGDVVALDALDHRDAELGREDGVFAEILPVASVERGAHDVDARTEQLVHAAVTHFSAQRLAVLAGPFDVPGLREGGKGRKLGVLAAGLRIAPVPTVHRGTDRRAVVAHCPLRVDAHARNRRQRHRARSSEKLSLLLQCHLGEGFLRRLEGFVIRQLRKCATCGKCRRNSKNRFSHDLIF